MNGLAAVSEPLGWGVVGLAVFLIGVTKSGFGSGLGFMVVPMTAAALGVTHVGSAATLGLLLPLLLLGDVVAVTQHRRHVSVAAIGRLAGGTMIGLVVGGLVLAWFHRHAHLVGAMIKIEVGVESLLLVGLHAWRAWRGLPRRLWREPIRGRVVGAFAGVSSTLAHAAGPIIATYLLPIGLPRRTFVGTCAVYFGVVNAAKLPAYVLSGQFAATPWGATLALVPLVGLGAAAGFWLNRHVSDVLFTRVVYGLTFVLGAFVLADGVTDLAPLVRPAPGLHADIPAV